ncbi:NAD(P)-dependent oxidoreductase [Agrococcus sp. SGAir0287]|uniref:NAD(P)-dependent oxidoreductase n=1 Tax=Agrococcus sp. SGAir0287 TaxID=2070347 RepID=UPI0010CCB5C7|nr:NAD(P)-dependent oxidoreductase [Agrococcus sp. SGAir0287]QCR20248.1 hydroxyacid dehydrogenase [Agrococcus sp. SGAir0287]
MSIRILVIGDSYMDGRWFAEALAALGDDVTVDVHQIAVADPTWPTDRIREFEGDPAQVAALLDDHEVLVIHGAPVTREVLEAAPSLRLIGCARGGPVNVDIEAAAERGVAVTTSPGKNAEAVAELTIGCVITLLRNVPASAHDLAHDAATGGPGVVSTFDGARWFGRELASTTLGLVGYGNVARRVAARATALGMRVVAFDPFAPAGAFEHAERVDELADLLPQADVLSVHARATNDNRHLIGAAELAALPVGASLVNSARESLVDEEALLAALESGALSGAALDVFEHDGAWRALAMHPSVLVLPHIGGATVETLRRGAEMIAAEVDRLVRDEPLEWAR